MSVRHWKSSSARLLLLGLVTLAALAPRSAGACRCVEPQKASVAYRRASAVVEATVLEVTPRPDIHGFEVKLQVTRAWKSEVPETLSFITGTTCVYEVQPREKHLVFLMEGQSGELTTHRCLGNGRVANKAAFLSWLEKKGKAVSPRPPR